MRSLVSSPDGYCLRCRPHSPFVRRGATQTLRKVTRSTTLVGSRSSPTADQESGLASMSEPPRTSTPPISQGTVINDRYEIRQSLGKGGMGEVFLAFDRSTQQTVALKIVREEARMPGDDEALRQELLARALGEPPQRLPRARPRAEPLRPHPGDGAHRRADAPHAYPAEEGPGRLHAGRVPQDRQRGLRGPRGHPRAGSRPRRSQARQRHGDRRQGGHPRLRLRPGARARLGAPPGRAARRRHAELHVARSACARAARAPKTTSTRSA